MKDKSALKVLQGILSDMEELGKLYRSEPKVSKALRQVYQSVAYAGSEILDKMTRDEKIREEKIRKSNVDRTE
jgi:hypothetical protein